MAINFPSSASLNSTYTYEGKTWKYNAQGAWEVSASTETGNEQGNTGEIAYYDATGSIIQGATAFYYDAVNLRVGIGITGPNLEHTLEMTGGINAKGGATFGGKITAISTGDVTLNLIADTDNSGENDNPLISMGQDGDEGNFTLGIVGNAGQIFTNSLSNAAYLNTKWGHNDLQFGVYGDMKMTILDSGNVGIGTNTPGSTMDIIGGLNVSKGATFGSNVVVENAGDVALTLKGDTDNSGENDNPLIRLEQDGGVVSCNIGINGESNNQFDGAQGNAFYIESESSSGSANQYIQFATDNQDRMTILGNGNIGINNNNPQHLLHLEGGGISADGATFDKLTLSGDLIMQEDQIITIGGDTEHIAFNGGGAEINIRANELSVDRYIQHFGDSSTAIDMQSGRLTISASTGGTRQDVIDVSGAGVTFEKPYRETVYDIGTITTNTSIDFNDGTVQTVTGNGDCLFTFTNPPASGLAGTVTLIITNGGANTTTWHSAVDWPGGAAPSLSSSGTDVLSFLTTDGGTNIYGFVGGLNFA